MSSPGVRSRRTRPPTPKVGSKVPSVEVAGHEGSPCPAQARQGTSRPVELRDSFITA